MSGDKRFFYSTIASDFNCLMNRYDLERRLEVVFDMLLREDISGRRVLDAGCGTGWFARRAYERGAQVVALDLGTALLAEARRKAPLLPVAGDALCLPFRAGAFDIVISSEAIEHTLDPCWAVAEMARVLRRGGILALTCPNRFWRWLVTAANVAGWRPYGGHENSPSFLQLERYIEAAGLRLEAHVGLHPWPFQLSWLRGASRWVERKAGARLPGRFMINQAVRAVKPDP